MVRPLVLATALCLAVGATPASAQTWFDTAWTARVPVVLVEPGRAARAQEYVDVVIDFSAHPFTDLADEVRVASTTGVQLPSLVHSISGSTAHVLFALPSIAVSGTETVYVYWGNPAAPPPAYEFPGVPVSYFTVLGYAYEGDDNSIAGLASLVAYGEIELAVTQVSASGAPYDQAAALASRIGGISGLCDAHFALQASTIYDDVAIWGFTDGNCLPASIYGLVDHSSGASRVPDSTDYVSQDFFPADPAGFDCDAPVSPDTGSIPELVQVSDPARACHLRFEPGHVLSGDRTLRYRSYYTGEAGQPWNAQLTAIATRSLELILQDNRVDVDPGLVETQTAGCPDVPRTGCVAAGKSSLQVKDAANDAQDKLSWKFQRAEAALALDDLGDPTTLASDLRVCVYDSSSATPRVATSLEMGGGGGCAGKPCWGTKGSTLRYADAAAASSGVSSLTVKAGDAGKGSIALSARGIALPLPVPFSATQLFEQDGELLVQLSSTGGDACFESRFDAAATKTHTGAQFKAIAK